VCWNIRAPSEHHAITIDCANADKRPADTPLMARLPAQDRF